MAATVLKLGKRPTQWILGGMMKGVDVLASNVPGPNFPLYVAGVKVDQFHASGPPADATLTITLFSNDGAVNLGVITDEAAVTDRVLFCAASTRRSATYSGSPNRLRPWRREPIIGLRVVRARARSRRGRRRR